MIAYVVFGWFECLALLLLGLSLLGSRWNIPRLIIAATVLTIGVGIVRSLGVVLGINSIGSIIIMALCLAMVFRIPFGKCLVVSSVSVVFLIVLELIVLVPLTSLVDMGDNNSLWLLTGIPHLGLIYFIAFLLHRKRLRLFDSSNET